MPVLVKKLLFDIPVKKRLLYSSQTTQNSGKTQNKAPARHPCRPNETEGHLRQGDRATDKQTETNTHRPPNSHWLPGLDHGVALRTYSSDRS